MKANIYAFLLKTNIAIACLIALLSFTESYAAVTITAPTLNISTAAYPSAYNALGNIVITEGANSDFAAATNLTLILTAPTNFEFQAGTGSVSFTAAKNITAASVVVTSTTITVTYSSSGTTKADALTISGINVRSTANSASISTKSSVSSTHTIAGITNNSTNFATLSSASTGAPANDQCAGAITVTCGNTYTGSTTNATTTNDPTGSCGVTPGAAGVWYTFVGDGSTVTASLCNSSYDTQILVYSGSCGSLTCVGGNEDGCNVDKSTYTFTSVVSTTYYIFISGYGGAKGNYELVMSCVTPPANDLCANAITISGGNTYNGTTTLATADAGTPCSLGAPGVWYTFTGNGNEVTLNYTTASFDGKLSVFTGTACGSYSTCVANVDGAGSGGTETTTFNSVNGTKYYVVPNGYNNATGSFTLQMISVACAAPTTQATVFSSSAITAGSMTIGWTRGNGNNVLVVARSGGAVNADPTNGTTYTANAAFSSGTQIGTGNYVVYNGTGTSVTITGLASSTTYYYAIYEFNTCNSNTYNTTELTGNAATTACSAPTQATVFTSSGITSSTTTIGWTRGNGNNVLVVAKAGSAPTDPTNGTSYTANAAYGSGTACGGGYVVYNGTGTSVAVTSLSGSTTYYYAIYEYNTCNSNTYTLTELAGNVVTSAPSYCTPAPSSCYGTGITNVTFGTINNTTGSEAGYYGNYSAMSNSVQQGSSTSVTVTFVTSAGDPNFARIWVDYNDNGVFTDAGEKVYEGMTPNSPNSFTANFTVPLNTSIGAHRMRIAVRDNFEDYPTPCLSGTSHASFEDYTMNVTAAPAMAWASDLTSQNTNSVMKYNIKQDIVGIRITTTGASNPLVIDNIKFTIGTTVLSDIANCKIYFSGSTSTFDPQNATQFGVTTAPASGTISINGSQTLAEGANYFWICYDISSTAVTGHTMDVVLESYHFGSTTKTPGTTSPAGSRPVVEPPVSFSSTIGDNVNGEYRGTSLLYDPADASYVIAGYVTDTDPNTGGESDFLTAKLDQYGQIVWSKSIDGTAGLDQAFDVAKTADGGYVSVGTTNSYGNGGLAYNMMAAKYNSAGTLQWVTVVNEDGSDYGRSVVVNTAGEIIIVGEGSSYYQAMLWKLDANGNVLLRKTIDGLQNAEDIIQTSDGGYLIGGYENYDYVVVKLSSTFTMQGKLQWDDGASSCYIYRVIENAANDYTVFGTTHNYRSSDFYAMRFTWNPLAKAAPTVAWAKSYGVVNDDMLHSACQSGDGGYVMCGLTRGLGVGGDAGYYIRISATGAVVWTNVVETGTYDDEAWDIVRHPGGGFVSNGLANRPACHTFLSKLGDVTGYNCASTATGGTANALTSPTFSSSSPSIFDPFSGISPLYMTSGGGSNPATKTGYTITSTCSTVLPIELAKFEVTCKEGQVLCSWATASETNNSYFTLEKSDDGITFEYVANIAGAGNSNALLEYSYFDDEQMNGSPVYYRLKQTDFDGQYTYSEMEVANCYEVEKSSCNVYPNPFNHAITVQFGKEISLDYTVEVKNYLGQIVLTKIIPAGFLRMEVNVNHLSEGTYFVKVYNAEENFTQKIIKIEK